MNEPHQLPDEAENERLGSIDDVGSLDSDHPHSVRRGKVDSVVGVLDGLESGELLSLLGLGDSSPDDGSRNDLVEGLEKYRSVLRKQSRSRRGFSEGLEARGEGKEKFGTDLQILEQVVDSRLDVQRVQPQGKDPSLPLSLRIEVLDLRRSLGFLERLQTRPGVEEMSDEGEVELGVSSDERGGSEVFSASDFVSVLEDLEGKGKS